MHQIYAPSRLRRLVSTLLALALVAGAVPGAVLAGDPPPSSALTANGTPLSAGTEPWFKGDVDVTITATPGGAAVATVAAGINTESLTATTTNPLSLGKISAEGTTTIRFYGIDVDGAQEATKTIYVKIDKTSPVTTATATPSTWTSNTVTVHLGATDAHSGIDKVYWRVGAGVVESSTASAFNLPAISDVGTTTVSYWATDKAGNSVATKTVDARIDKIAPTTASNRVASYVNTSTITFTATDTGGSGVKTTYYKLDSDTTRTAGSVTTTATGLHTLRFWSEDNAGNVETSTANASTGVTFTVTADLAPPSTTLVTKPGLVLANWQSSVVTFSLTATDTGGAGIGGTFYRLDGGTTVAYTPGAVVTVSKEGSTLLEYWSVDLGGVKEATNTVTVRVDTIKPSSSHNGIAEYTGASSISIAATDLASGIDSIRWWLDGGSPAPLAGVVSGSTTLTVSLPAVSTAGTHTVGYVVTDRAGNTEATKTVTFHVTRQPAFTLASAVVFMTNTKNPAPVSLSTFLKDGATPLGGRQVVLEYSTSSSFANKRTIVGTTNTSGWVRVSLKVTSRTYLRFRYAGEADYKPAVSKTVAVVPKVALSTPLAKSPQRAGRAFTVTGKIYPAHAAGTRIKIERYLIVRGKRVSRGYVWATVTAKNRYAYTARLSLGRGTWQLRAVAPYDTAHNTTASGFRTIVVR